MNFKLKNFKYHNLIEEAYKQQVRLRRFALILNLLHFDNIESGEWFRMKIKMETILNAGLVIKLITL